MKALRGLLVLLVACVPSWALAAEIDGGQLSVLWGVPFAGMLLSIALVPLVAPHFWHRHFGKLTAAWALAFLLPFAAVFGAGAALVNLVHALLARSEEHTSELQSQSNLVCRLLLEKKKKKHTE